MFISFRYIFWLYIFDKYFVHNQLWVKGIDSLQQIQFLIPLSLQPDGVNL